MQSTQTPSSVPRVICLNVINRPMRNLTKRNCRGGAYVPARTSAQRRFHTKNTRIVRRVLNDGCAPAGRHGRAHRHRPYPSQPTTRGVPLPHHIVHSIVHANHTWCPLPHRGYAFDSAGLASATQPTLGNDASEEAPPLGVVLFLIAHYYHTRRMISPHKN